MEVGTIERAFELARNSECRTVTQIITRLRKEGRADAETQLDGASIRKQLNAILKARKQGGHGPDATD